MIRAYIWLPRLKQEGVFNGSVIGWGHTAIEIVDGIYMSKWPKREDTPYGYTLSYEEDIDTCGGRKANETIEISNLNEQAMAEYWETAREKEFRNVLHNCCRVSAKTLNHGFFWSNYNSGVGTFLKRTWRGYANYSDTLIHAYGLYLNQVTTWTPHTVSGLANYIKKIVE
jgi:hypothetical protein